MAPRAVAGPDDREGEGHGGRLWSRVCAAPVSQVASAAGKRGRRLLDSWAEQGRDAGAEIALGGDGGVASSSGAQHRDVRAVDGPAGGRRLQKWHDPSAELMCMMKLRSQGFVEMTPTP